MRRFHLFAAAIVFTSLTGFADAALLAGWDFNGESTGTTSGAGTSFIANTGTDAGTAVMTFNSAPTAGSSNLGVDSSSSTTVNALPAAAAGNHVNLRRGERWNNRTLTLDFDAAGHILSVLTFAANRSNSSGVSGFQASYSTDGVLFTDFGGIQLFPVNGYDVVTVDPGNALDDAATASIRLTFTADGGGIGSGVGVRFDNFQVNAEPASPGNGGAPAVPEPATAGLAALAGLALLRRRRA